MEKSEKNCPPITIADLKDGIYHIKVSDPVVNYLVVKRYSGKPKYRYMTTKEDCLQQIYEWDDDYRKECPEDKNFKGGFKKKPKKKTLGYNRTFQVIDSNSKDVCFIGKGKEVASKYGCHINTVMSAAAKNSLFMHSFTIQPCA